MAQITRLIDRTIRVTITRTTTNRTDHSVGLTTCEPGTMVGGDATTNDERISAVAHTETIITKKRGTLETKPGGVEAKKTIDDPITRKTALNMGTDPTMKNHNGIYRTDDRKRLNPP